MRGRNLFLVALDWTRPKDPPLSLGHASIISNLIAHDIPVHGASWAVNSPQFNADEVTSHIMAQATPSMDLALGAFVWNEHAIQKIIQDLRNKKFKGNIILGGPQISYVKNDTDLFKYYPQADVFIRGYGEEALAQIYKAKTEKPPIRGVTYQGEPGLGGSANVNLDELPSPYLTGLIKPQSFIRWETQRGCPFRCSFCQHRESDATMTRRNLPLSRVLEEAKWITDNHVINDVAVLDPTFNSGPNHLAILDVLAAGKYKGKIALQCRAEMVRPAFLEKVEALNRTAHVVLEFGLQTTNKEETIIIQRPNNMKKIREVLEKTKELGIETELSLIFGLPHQTVASFQESISFCKEMDVSRIYAFPLMLLRGTPLHEEKDKLGLVESDEINVPGIDRIQRDIPHVISSPSFSRKDWEKMAEIADGLSVYNERIPKDGWVQHS